MSSPPGESLTGYVARFITTTRPGDVPRDVMRLGKRSVLDGLGLALAGNAAESGHIVRQYLRTLGCPTNRGCTVIGTPLKLPPRFAAFANGIAIHADDYDDTQLAAAKDRVYGLLTHPTAPALPPVLAFAERDNRTGLEMLTAYQVAVEVETKVSEAINPRHYDHGFHSTATIGTIAAAAGAARMLRLNEEQTRRALGIAAILYIALASTVFGFGAWGWLLKRHAAATVAPFSLLVPIFGMSSAAIFLGEDLTASKLVAASLVIAGLALVVIRRQPAPQPPLTLPAA